ncbi:MAG: iron-sulfur cluster carrier protein ApbC [Arsenophonus sp. ET-KM2-MAG3]
MNGKPLKQIKSKDLIKKVIEVLDRFFHSTLQSNLSALEALYYCELLDNVLYIELVMPFAWQSPFNLLVEQQTLQLQKVIEVKRVEWKLRHNVSILRRVNNLPGINGIRNIIAVSSCKGGVGKSCTTVNLALALAKEGVNVGILDADVYGPSIPIMLATKNEHPKSSDGHHMTPIMAYGLATNSIGYLINDDNAMIWRGPMASKALIQMLKETEWPNLDYLLIDMPPGTGDIQLTLSQSIPVTAAIVITTPQDIALLDAKKGIIMFERVKVPILGVIENMSFHICSNCGYLDHIFGYDGARRLTKKYKYKLLGKIPLHISLREDLDQGQPTVIKNPNGKFANIYREIALTISSQMYWTMEKKSTEIIFRVI